ncbi:hypothetical protein SDC9_208676 [bioreactor metagenome]|uniref:Uncharacterized protein n=1 Tax=bioreactor metagenome TaxID=1076179 RepID=A0A645JMV4_9ZZZZ
MAVLGKHGGFIIAEMAQPIRRECVAAHRLNQARYLACATRHQRAFERRLAEPVEYARGDADDVFGCCADFIADQVGSVVKAYQIA